MESRVVPERDVQKSIIDWITSAGGVPLKIAAGAYQESAPDIIALWRSGRYVAIEVKRDGLVGGVLEPEQFKPKNKSEILQKRFLIRVKNAGGVGFFADNLEAVKEKLLSIN